MSVKHNKAGGGNAEVKKELQEVKKETQEVKAAGESVELRSFAWKILIFQKVPNVHKKKSYSRMICKNFLRLILPCDITSAFWSLMCMVGAYR